MPWRPSWTQRSRLDSRLDPYRERAGRLFGSAGIAVGTVYVQVEKHSRQVGGHLWWRRWEPEFEAVHGYVEFTDGRAPSFIDFVDRDDLDTVIKQWTSGRFLLDAVYGVTWLDDESSELMRRSLGLEPEEARE